MQIQQHTGDDIAVQVCPIAKRAYDAAIERDVEYLRAWEAGQFPDLCCYLHARQIRNGNPIVIAQRLLRKVDSRKTRPSL